ncbi:hypothetical protein IU11_05485, partial [Cellulosimicrobium sp. MM]
MNGSTDRACETTRRRRRATGLVAGGLVGGLALAAGLAVPAAAESVPAARRASRRRDARRRAARPDGAQRATLETYLEDTYTSLEAMTDEETGLPADNIEGDLTGVEQRVHVADEHRRLAVVHRRGARPGPGRRGRGARRLATTIDT